jgi:hypothetical protein
MATTKKRLKDLLDSLKIKYFPYDFLPAGQALHQVCVANWPKCDVFTVMLFYCYLFVTFWEFHEEDNINYAKNRISVPFVC